MKRPAYLVGAALLSAAAILLPAAGASATQPPVTAAANFDRPAGHSTVTTPDARASVLEYWTEDRMAKAIPADRGLPGKPSKAPAGLVPSATGPAVKVPGAAPTEPKLKPSASPSPQAGGFEWPGPQYTPVASTAGKVFFTSGGLNYVCSGTATNSENKDVVMTAGHCVHSGGGGTWHTNWVFVPNRIDGTNPFGVWTARELWSLNGWILNSDFAWDIGAAVLFDNGGSHLVNVVGGQGIAWNQPRGQFVYSFGYPAAAPYGGERLIYCYDYTFDDTNFNPATLGIVCDMTGGSSGGGWLMAFDGSAFGYVNSVNSYKYNGLPQYMFGPYFGDGAANLYNAVRAI